MKRIDVIASEESYNNLSTFTDIKELNKTVRTYRDIITTSIKRADVQTRLITLLELLKRHSCKQIGVSYMCKNTIADKLKVSYKTVQRLVKKLEDLGIIRQVPTKRKKDMLQTANAIIILPTAGEMVVCRRKQYSAGAPAEEMSDKIPSKQSKKCPTIKTTTVSLKQKIKNIRKESTFATANYVAHWVPNQFAKLASYYYDDAKTIQEFWKVVRQQNRIVNHWDNLRAFNAEQELSIGLMSFKELVMKIKDGKRIKNIFGYFNGIVDNLMSKLIFDDEFMGGI